MDKERAIRAFAALAQESRLGVFRLLVRTGAEGMAAGEIARAMGVSGTPQDAQQCLACPTTGGGPPAGPL